MLQADQPPQTEQDSKLWVMIGLTVTILVILMIYQALQVWVHSRTTGQESSGQLTSLTQSGPLMLNNLSDDNEQWRDVGGSYGNKESEQIVEYTQDEVDLNGLAKHKSGNWWYK